MNSFCSVTIVFIYLIIINGYAKNHLLEYGKNKTCIIKLNQTIDSVEYQKSDNTKVDIDTKQYKTLKINFKYIHQAAQMVIVSGQIRHALKFKYNAHTNELCRLFIKKRQAENINLKKFKIEKSFAKASRNDLSIELKQLKYFDKHLILELILKNKTEKDMNLSKTKIRTFKRKGFLNLKTARIQLLKINKSNCTEVKAKKTKTCHILIKNFKKQGYGIRLTSYIKSRSRNNKNVFTVFHKFDH